MSFTRRCITCYGRMSGVARERWIGMLATILTASLSLSGAMLHAPELKFFPGLEYEKKQPRLERRVLARWPSPSGLLHLWRSGELSPEQKQALLLGGASFHDPQILPIYAEALASEDPRLRQVAAFAYRDLLADASPNVANGVSAEDAKALAMEVVAVAEVLRSQSLISLWIDSLLSSEGGESTASYGQVFRRSRVVCLYAIERLLQSHDLELLVRAYLESNDQANRIALMRLIEGYAVQRFLILPKGERAAWGMKDYEQALQRLDGWIERWFEAPGGFDQKRMLATTFSELGAPPRDPFGAEACPVWRNVLSRGGRSWWPQAASRLYHCGGPPVQLSVFQPESDENTEAWGSLMDWYKLR